MALRETVVKETGHNGLQFKQHDAAHLLLDSLVGLELGPSSHNSFGLEGSSSVAPADDFNFYKDGQVYQNGKYIETDIVGEAEAIPVADDSQDYVLSSHVFEHIPNPFAAFAEWERVLKTGGYVFMIVPQRDALDSDRGRDLTTFEELLEAFSKSYTPVTIPAERTTAAGGPRGHYWVYSSQSLKDIIARYSESDVSKWELFYEEDPDKKVGNGFCLVYKIIKPVVDATVEREEWTTTQGDVVETKIIDPEVATPTPEEAIEKAAKVLAPKLTKTPRRKPKSQTL